ncbi:MAG: FAD-binding oxidoreductase [Candidatus Thorarchaeota archaeon]
MTIKARLIDIVGTKHVTENIADRYIYSFDMTENPPQKPDFVVMPTSVGEICAIVQLANETLTPLVPYVTGQNVGGLTIPQIEGAIVVDLRRMNKVLEIDKEAMYVLVEPGVTFGHLKRTLESKAPGFRYTYPLAPPYTSVVANALLQGLCDLSTQHGAMADFINGLESVLPTGEIVRVGSGILGENNWFGRYPLPDLVGLFSGWQGMSGIVTKMALKIWTKPKHKRHVALFTFGEHETTNLLKQIAATRVIEDADCMSISIVKMLLGVDYPVRVLEGEPDYGTVLAVSGSTETEVSEKMSVIQQLVDNANKCGEKHLLIDWDTVAKMMGDQARSWIDFPSDAFKVLTEFDGLTWCGTYIHPQHWGKALASGRSIVEEYGFELMAFLKPMHGMHFAEFKFIIRFEKKPSVVEKVRQCNIELLDFALDLGAIPYKTPVWAAKKLHKRIDPGYLKLLKKLRRFLDPNGIMNPGRWAIADEQEAES